MNRIDRISAILIQLQSRRVVKAGDIAERFSISLRTVYRDVKTLEEAGIPIIGEAGVGYSIMDGYRLPPVMFTREEATAFLTAEKFIEKLTDSATIANHRSAMYKVRAILRTAEKDLLEGIDQNIEVLRNRIQVPIDHQDHIQTILNSIAGKNIISIDYFAQHSQENTRRELEPVGIFFMDSYWHLVAWCHLRNDYRDFRIDRIKKLSITGKRFKGNHPTLKAWIAQTAKEKHLETVIIEVDKAIYSHLEQQKYYSGFVSEIIKSDKVEMTFLTNSIEGFARWYLMYADSAEVIQSEALKTRVRELISVIAERNEALPANL